MCSSVDDPEHYRSGCCTVWNTFRTRGECPGCQHVWTWTSCLACGEWSRHDDWYVTEPDDGEASHP